MDHADLQKYYYPSLGSIMCYFKKEITSFWDAKWSGYNIKQFIENAKRNNRKIVKITSKYLKRDARILEGGCGPGDKVYWLCQNGFNVTGVDTSKDTVLKINSLLPGLDVREGNVMELDFPDEYFDGYWSIGVIEHDLKNITRFIDESRRVIKLGGYLFLSFPSMNVLRRNKSKMGFYNIYNGSVPENQFYQCIFDYRIILKYFNDKNFILIRKKGDSALYGLIDEIDLARRLINPLYMYCGSNLILRGIKFILVELFEKFLTGFCGHSIILVMQKKNNDL